MFCQYLTLWVEQKELALGLDTVEETPAGNPPESSCVYPKAKAKSHGKPSMPPVTIDLELEDEECWDRLSQPMLLKENENAQRLDHLEGVLSEIVNQLQVLSQHITAMPNSN